MPTAIEKTGVVKSTNAYGFKLEGSEDYYDYSKQNDVEHATKGTTVNVKVTPKADGKWWVNALTIVESNAPATNGSSGPSREYRATSDFMDRQDREMLIIRQSSLKAAVEFYGMVSHDAEACGKASEHIFVLAEKFEQWVNR